MTTENNEQEKTQLQEAFDTNGLLLNYLANWKWFVLCAIICLIGGYLYYLTCIPMYQVSASIYLKDDNLSKDVLNLPSTRNMSRRMMTNDMMDETEIEILKSKNNVIRIVDSLDLAYNYYYVGKFRDTPLYENNAIVASMDNDDLKGLYSPIEITIERAGQDKYNVKAKTVYAGIKEEKNYEKAGLPLDVELSYGTVHLSKSPVIDKLTHTEKITILNPRTVASIIAGNLNIAFKEKSEKIVRINLTTNNIKKGTDIVVALIDFYNQNIIEDKNRSAVQSEAFILDRLVMIADELKDVENRLLEYRNAHNISTDIMTQASMNMSLQSGFEQELAAADAEMSILDEIERIVTTSDTYETLPAAISNTTITQIIDSYNRKVANLNRTLEGSTSDNPLVISMRDELSRDKTRILQNIASAKRNLTTKRQSISKLENRSAGQLASTPTVDKGLNEIFREQQVKVNIYTFLLQRREEIAIQKTLATNSAKFTDNPVGTGPISPDRVKILGIAFLIGLLIPALIIFVKRMIFPVFADKEELERLTKVPVLGEICVKDKNKTDEIVMGENVSTPIAELFRLLRNAISFTKHGASNKVILVTSSISGEGKTFVAINLAMTYALMGKKTLVMGLDLRRPTLARRLGVNNHVGTTSYISGQCNDIEKMLVPSNENPNLFVLPAGPVPPNPNELLMSDRMQDLMDTLRKEFDYIIIDSAPIGVISDSYLLTRFSDLQIYVSRANYTSKHCLKLLHTAISRGMMPNAYIVVNAVNIASNSYVYHRYGNYGHYGKSKSVYGYGYTSKK